MASPANRQIATSLWPGPLQWHFELHRRWGGCTLHFWLMRLPAMYERKTFFDKLEAYVVDSGAGAYATYELSGEFDILLRVWLPQTQATGRFADNLDEDLGLEDSREYQVVEILRHWVWSGEESHVPVECDLQALQAKLDAEKVESINRLSDESHSQDAARPSAQEVALARDLMSDNALADLRGTTGIRVLVRLEATSNLRREDRLRTANLVAEVMDRITRPKGRRRAQGENGSFTVDEVSLYRCKDRSLLLLCRVPYVRWHALRDELLKPLADLPGVSQTTTWPALSQNFVRSRDRLQLTPEISDLLSRSSAVDPAGGGAANGDGARGRARRTSRQPPPPPPPSQPPGASEFFDLVEETHFEAKGSAFTPLDAWLSRVIETPEEKYLKESSGYFRDTIAKNVVAMLNSGGGVILIGVLERDRYERHKSDRLRLRLSRLPVAGRFHVIGLQDPTFRDGGWDGFELKFNRLLKESIDGEVADLVHISRDWYKEQTLAVVRVGYVGIGDGYFLRESRDKRFVIRRGASTDELSGQAVMRYIEQRRERDRQA